jgi:hypothetical protein
MLDQRVIDLAGRMIQVQLDERRMQLQRETEFILNEMAARGTARSGMYASRVHEFDVDAAPVVHNLGDTWRVREGWPHHDSRPPSR